MNILPTHSQLKSYKIKKYVSKSQNFKSLLSHVNGVNVHDILNKVVIYDTRN
jgi:hypothetical protein